MLCAFFFFFKQKTACELEYGLVGAEMCIRDRAHSRPVSAAKIRNAVGSPGTSTATSSAHAGAQAVVPNRPGKALPWGQGSFIGRPSAATRPAVGGAARWPRPFYPSGAGRGRSHVKSGGARAM